MHLLLVDDEPSLLNLLGQHLQRHGHLVEQAASVAEARLHLQVSFDAAIVDWTLLDGTGLDVALPLLASNYKLHVIFTSGYPLDASVVPAAYRGRVHILQKPFLPRALAQILNSLTL